MTISIIVAIAENNAMGINNQLPWHLPKDLKRYKETTMGHHMIMGRKTYDSIGRPLPGRTSIVVTRNTAYQPEGVIVTDSIENAIAIAKERGETEVFIVGGAQIYQQSLHLVDKLYLTVIHKDFEADTFFPEIDEKKWKTVKKETFEPDEKNPYRYSFIDMEKN